jgi:glutathione reductase (NADPH)
METRRYDFVAIGGGNAGLTAAARVAGAGRRVALVDRGPIGGLCSLNGCNPKKVLVRATEVLDEIRHAARHGIEVGEPRIDWSRVIDRKEGFTRPVTPASERSLAEQGIDLVRGAPRFEGRHDLIVEGTRLQADAVLVATGSTPRPLDFPGAELVQTTDDILALRRIPRDLVVVGAGVVAFEFGQVFARLGARVTVLAPRGRALAGHDPDLVESLIRFSGDLGVKVMFHTPVKAVQRRGDHLAVEFEADGKAGTLDADFVLNAAGRVASIGELGLDAAGVTTDARGVVVDDFLRSPSNRDVFAAGDAHGRFQLSPVASYEGRIVARNLLEGDAERVAYESIPKVLWTVPPLASVGLTEPEARARGLAVSVATSDMAEWKVYAIHGDPVARAKVLVASGSGRILGAHLYGDGAGEKIHVFALAIRFGISADDLRRTVYGYPTLASTIPYTLR